MLTKNLLRTILVSAAVSACSLNPVYRRPVMEIPPNWSAASNGISRREGQPQPFWEELGNEELGRAVDAALGRNLDLQAALHRIEQARAQAKTARAPLFPSVDASGGMSRDYREESEGSTALRLGGSLSYEIDLWGKNRSQAEAAGHRAEATRYDRDALRLVVAGDAAVFYAQILAFDDRIQIAENNLRNAEEVLRIIEARFQAGAVSALEVSQQKVAVNDIRAALTSLNEQRAATANALAVLLARPPQNFERPKGELASLKVPEASLTPPAELLRARPDIQGAEAGLLAANADIGAARAAFFPSVRLGVDPSLAASGFGGPANAAVSLAASVLAPIFSGGRLTGNLESVTARQRELAASYQRTVLTAFREVEDALAALKRARDQAVLARESVGQAQAAYDIAKARFDAGSIDYLTLLETQRSLSQTEDQGIRAELARIETFVQLRKALGA
jgi:NodT family efflux transporter outer membrane factor (OMF) lipoprotein